MNSNQASLGRGFFGFGDILVTEPLGFLKETTFIRNSRNYCFCQWQATHYLALLQVRITRVTLTKDPTHSKESACDKQYPRGWLEFIRKTTRIVV